MRVHAQMLPEPKAPPDGVALCFDQCENFNQGLIGVGVWVRFGDRVGVRVRVGVLVGVAVCCPMAVAVRVGVRVLVRLELGVGERVVVGDSVTIMEGVRVGVIERVGEALGLGVALVPPKRYTPPFRSKTYTSPLTSSPKEETERAESMYSMFCQVAPSRDNPQIRPLQ